MKTLSNYIEEKQTAAFEKYGAFFAFSNRQFDEKKKEGVIYRALGAGLIVPSKNARALFDELETIHEEGVAQDLKENGAKNIIHRELANYECQITYDYTDVVEALEAYGISEGDVKEQWPAFLEHCEENGYF